ncbi:MAG: hypothetical protein CMO67_01245 [Verrucomicrobiales bacterium]|nr:hypothetical protein [Verrucomicrobiales bacterium]|tara:strand:+ start:888 stop:1070 length:183 start_codon:yes stop_codon:yes gene_type:complete
MMLKKMISFTGACLLIAGGILLSSATGCGSLDAENVSERPWNEPKGYQFFGSGNSRRGNR